jgi:FKBP-type peptidyl-prolyl cis-trans isomerase (trigger factor)
MKYQRITLELPEITDEAAASLQKFIDALRYAVDEQYYKQIHCYYLRQLDNLMVDAQFTVETPAEGV